MDPQKMLIPTMAFPVICLAVYPYQAAITNSGREYNRC